MGGYSTDWDSSRDYDWDKDEKVTKKSAREYTKEDKRKYTGNTSSGIPAPVGKDIKTDSKLAQILVVDVTGSMREWPGLIFEKIATLYNETNVAMQGIDPDDLAAGKKKANQLLEMSVIAVGDAYTDAHPLQVVDFSKGPDLVNGVNKIFPEGAGGSFGRESYELVAYYLDKHCQTPNIPKGAKPTLIFACDEDFYDKISKQQVKKFTGDNISDALDSDKVIKRLSEKFDMYVLRPEPQGKCSVYDIAQQHWEKILGKQRVLKMESPERLVDCIIGISAYASNNFDIGEALLERRQTPAQVKEVMRVLHPMLDSDKSKKSGKKK